MSGRRKQAKTKIDSYVEVRLLLLAGGLILALALAIPALIRAADLNNDGLDDTWEAQYGFSTNAYANTNLVGWWQMQPNSSNVVADSWTNQINGTLTNFPSNPYGPGLFSNALYFPATGQVSFPTNSALNGATNQFTFSTWFQSTNGLTQPATIATWGDSQTNSWTVSAASNGSAGVTFSDDAGDTQAISPSSGATSIYDGNWHQVAVTLDTNQLATVYVDGQNQASGSITNWNPAPVASFTFGIPDSSSSNQPYALDDTRLYNRALGAAEIAELPPTYSDFNGTGLSVLDDELEGLNPLSTDQVVTTGFVDSGLGSYYGTNLPSLAKTNGDAQVVPAGTFATNPLTVLVTDGSGNPLVGAPITFAIAPGSDGGISQTSGGSTVSSISLTTDTNGNATVYYESDADVIRDNTVTATAVTNAGNVSVSFTEYCGIQNGLVSWLNGDTGVTADGSNNVSLWQDQSPATTNSASQTTSGIQPQWASSAIAGHSAIQFDGSSTYLAMPACIADDFTMIAVFRSSLGTGGGGGWFNAGGVVDAETAGVVNDFGISLDQYGDVLTGIGNPDTTQSSTVGGYNDNRAHIVTFQRTEASGNFSQYVDSALQGTLSGNTGPLTSPPRITVGATQTLAQYFGGDVAEVLLFTRNLSSDEQASIEGYLADKYDIYSPDATWPLAYSSDAQAQIAANGWNKTQADAYVTFTSGTPPIPADGLLLWLAAGSGVTTDDSGNVQQWVDQSPSGHVVPASTSISPPTLGTDSNGNPCLNFNGSEGLLAPDYIPANGDLTIIAVEADNYPGNFSMIETVGGNSGDLNTGATRSLADWYGSQDLDMYYAGTNGGPTGNPGEQVVAASTYQLSSGTASFYLRGDANGSGNATASTLSSGLYIGTGSFFGLPWNGSISSILVYNRILSGSEMAQAEGYLGDQYGVYAPDVTWPLAYNADVQALIYENEWNETTTQSYVNSVGNTDWAPIASPSGGQYSSSQTVTVTSATADATIYYTTDGTTPTTGSSSIANGGTLTVSSTSEYKFMAADGTSPNSPVSTEVYEIGNSGGLAAGDSFSMTLRPDGTLWTWGDDSRGQQGDNQANWIVGVPQQVPSFSGATFIAAAGDHALAVDNTGAVWAWGADDQSQCGDGGTTDLYVPTQLTSLSSIGTVYAAQFGGFAVDTSGNLYGWGNNSNGQLGDGTTNNESTPEAITSVTNVVKVAASPNFTLALKTDGTVWATGNNDNGELGDGTQNDETYFQQVPNLANVIDIAVGWKHALALCSDGSVWSWGYGGDGELGHGGYNSISVPQRVLGLPPAVAVVAVDSKSYVVLADGTLRCFGGDNEGELGLGAGINSDQPSPVQPSGVQDVIALAAGTYHTFVCSSKGAFYGWGDNTSFRLTEDFTNINYNSPTEVHDPIWQNMTSVAAVSATILAVKNDGTLWATGQNNAGSSGSGNWATSERPVQAVNISNVSKIASGGGGSVALAIDSSGQLWSWGGNWDGQLAIGNYNWLNAPGQVPGVTNATAIASGDNHILFAESDGSVWACGDDSQGELGDGTTNNETVPIEVTSLSDATQVAAGTNTSFVLESDGSVWAWGQNDSGQLGLGTTGNVASPTQITSLPAMVAISVSGNNAMGIDTSGNVWSWGILGNSDGTPLEQSGVSNVVAVAAGTYHEVALQSDGTMWAMGSNFNGQLGDPSYNNSSTFIQFPSVAGGTAICAGYDTSVVVKQDGTVAGFGGLYYGQLAGGMGEYDVVPKRLFGIAMSETPPTISLSSPSSGTSETEGSAFDLQSSVSTSGASISKVEYYLNGVKIGTSTTPGTWDYSYTPTSYGTLTFESVAVDSTGVASVSSPVSYTVAYSGSAPTPPTAPSNVTVTEGAPGTVYIGWTNGSGASSILIQEQNPDGSWTTVDTITDPTQTSAQITGLTSGQDYNFQVIESNGAGTASGSGTFTASSPNLPVVAVFSGNEQAVATSSFATNPLIVQVTDVGGNSLPNVSVSFAMASGSDGGLASTSGGTTASSQTATTNASGQATIYYQAGDDVLVNNTINASVTAGSGNVATNFTECCGVSSGLSLWFEADLGVTANGSGQVSAWADQSPNQFVAAQSNSSNQPVLVANADQSASALQFSGGQTLSGTGTITDTASQGATLIVLASNNSPGSQQYSVTLGGQYNTGQTRNMGYLDGGQTFSNCNSDAVAGSAPSAGEYVEDAATLGTDGSSVTFYRNGSQTATSSVGNTQTITPGFSLGSFVSGDFPWQGNIVEVLAYNRTLSTDELAQVDGYLADKYGFYSPNATWPLSFSSDVQTQIAANQWDETQAEAYATFVASSPPIPPAGLVVWLKADSGLSQSAGAVTGWTDQSPYGNNATPSGTPPTVITDANGNQAVHFDGSGNNFLSISDNPSVDPNQYTILAAAKDYGPGSSQFLISRPYRSTGAYGGWTSPFLSYGVQLSQSSSTYQAGWVTPVGGSNTNNGNSNSYDPTQTHEFSWRYDGSNQEAYTAGTLATSVATSGNIDYSGGSANLTIGVHSTTDLRPVDEEALNADVYEILVYNRALSDTELQQAEGYLADKYGLYDAYATWPLAFSSEVQAEITRNQWNKVEAENYAALEANNSSMLTHGLLFWCKADAGVTQDGSGNVNSWADQTGNFTVTQSGTARPTYVANAVNGEPALQFNGSQCLFNSSTIGAGANADMSMIVVGATSNPGAWQYTLYLGNTAGYTCRGQGYDNGSQLFDSSSGNGCAGAAAPYPNVFTAEETTVASNLTGITFYRNGTQAATGTVSTMQNLTPGISVGAYNGSGAPWQGDISEVLVYDHQLSSDELTQVDGYLADKYGYYSSNATWPSSFDSDVQAEIEANQWDEAQANAYVAAQTNYPDIATDGLVLHLDSSVGVTANGSGQVSAWADQSPFLNNAVQTSSGNQPTLVSNAIGSKPALSFNGSSSYLTVTDSASLRPTTLTIIAAASMTSGTSNYQPLVSKPYYNSTSWNSPWVAYFMGLDPTNSPYIQCAIADNAQDAGTGQPVANGQSNVFTGEYDGTTESFYVNGGTPSTTSVTGAVDNGDNTRKDLVIGSASSTWFGQFFNGQISEILVYNRALSTEERQQAEGYLGDKYGLYNPSATWPSAYSSDVQVLIATYQWTEAQANAYVASETNYPDISSDGLVLHLDSSVGITSSGGNVSQWADQSPFFNNANQGSSGNQPQLISSRSDLNGKPVIRFNGSSSYLDVTDNPSLRSSGSLTIIAAAQTYNTTATQQDVIDHPLNYNYYGAWATAPYYSYDLAILANNTEDGYLGTSGGVTLAGTTARAAQMSISTVIYDGSNFDLYDSGSLQASTGASGAIDFNGTTLHDLLIGAGSNYTGLINCFNGDVAEVLVYNRALSSAEQQAAEVYLADKYGLYDPNATWPLAYSSDVQSQISLFGWTKAEADAYVAFVATNPSVPADGLAVWLEADQGVTVDGSGNVSQWTDQSAQHNNANQGSSGNRPAYVSSSSSLNGKPTLQFNGSSNYLDVTDSPSLKPQAAVTVIAAAQALGTGQQDFVAHPLTYNYYGYWATAPYYSYGLGVQTNFVENGYLGTNGGTNLSGAAATPSTMAVSTMIYDGTNFNIYNAGSLQGTTPSSGAINYDGTNAHDLLIGAHATYAGITGYLNGAVSEVLVYDRALTPQEQEQVEVYLADKYGLYHPDATWPLSYSSDVQSQIALFGWTKAQADAYVAFVATDPSVPTDGLALWLSADQGVTADGSGNVSQWADRSLWQNNANQSNSGNQPTLISSLSELNNKPVLQFNGTSDYLDVTDNPSLKPSNAVTVIAVAQTNASTQQDIVARGLTYSYYGYWAEPPLYSYDLGVQTGGTERGYIGNSSSTGSDLSTGTPLPQTMSIQRMVYDGTTQTLYDNGNEQVSAQVSGAIEEDSTNVHDLLIGASASYSGINNFLNGDVAEVLVYNGFLTPAQDEAAEGYLGDKYTIYAPGATWPLAYSSDVQFQIALNGWNKQQADAYVAFENSNSSVMTDGLMLWLEANNGVTADGSGNVSAWADQTGNYTVTQSTSGSQPALVTNDINSQPALRFTGTQSLSQAVSLGAGINQGMTIVAVAMTTAPSAFQDSVYLGTGGGTGQSRGTGYDNSDQFADLSCPTAAELGGVSQSGIAAPAAGTFVTEAVTLTPNLQNLVFYRNGIETAATQVNSLADVASGIFVGNRQDGTAPWQGDIAELMVFDHQLSTTEMNQLGEYLGNKYGIYNPNATWFSTYSSDVQARIAAYQWTKAQADAWVAAHPSSPTMVSSGLAMWLKAGAGVTQDGSGNVSAWADQTGNYTLTQSGSNEPTYVSNDINTQPAMRFNGSQWLATTGTISGINADCTVITVANTSSPGSAQYSVYMGSGSGSQYTNRAVGYSSSQELYDTSGSSASGGAASLASSFVTEIATLDPTLTDVTFYQNGNQTATGTVTGLQNLSGGIAVGAAPGPGNYWQGDIAEVIVYNHQLSASDLAQVDGYLADKYGLFDPNASWPAGYSEAVEEEIFKHQWNKAQADNYVALQSNNPSMLTNGLTVWLRADTGVTQDGSGNVTAIADQTGNYTLTQTTSGAEPTYVASDINSKPALRFNGSQSLSNLSAVVTGLNQDMTVITVANTSAPTSQEYSIYVGQNNGTAGINRAVGYSGSSEFFDTAGSCLGGLAPPSGTFTVEATTLDPTLTNVSFYQNGTATGTGTLTGVQNLSSGITLGAAAGASNAWQGDIAEVLVYDHQLSSSELQQVGLYLATKYGLAANGPAPTISPNGGSFSSTQSVTITTTISGATIHYTLDGTAPTPSSPTYSSAISLSNSALVQAIAVSASGQVQSQVASAQFYINDSGDTGLPPAPTGLTVTSTSSTQNNLSWTLSGAGTYSQIYVYRSTNGGSYQLIAVLSSTATSFVDSTVTAGDSYTYEVGTVNQSGVGTSSGSASVTPGANTPLGVVVTTPTGATPLP